MLLSTSDTTEGNIVWWALSFNFTRPPEDIHKGASPWRADARLGYAHARSDRCRQIEAVNATALPRGTSKMNRL